MTILNLGLVKGNFQHSGGLEKNLENLLQRKFC